MKSIHSNSSLAIAAGGIFGFAVLVSGIWHPKAPMGGLTQVGRTASVTFEDGTVMNLTESETDLDILKRRRMQGWNGHEFKQIFIMADGEEIEVGQTPPRLAADSEDLSSGDHLLLAANTTDAPEDLTTDGKRHRAVVADLQIDGKARAVESEVDEKDGVVTDLIDGKDRVYIDYKDAPVQPVFALTADQSLMADERLDLILMSGGLGGGSDFGSTQAPLGTGSFSSGNNGTVTSPPIGVAVPEPGALPLIGATGVLGLAFYAWRKLAATA